LHCDAFDAVVAELTAQSLERRPPSITVSKRRLAFGVPQLFNK
jgi:hypothetical protein